MPGTFLSHPHLKPKQPMQPLRWLRAWLLGGLFCIVAPGAAMAQNTPSPTAAVQQLWASTLPDSSGVAQALGRYRGKPVVVNFWASWCGPCVQEMPELSALSQQYAAKGIEFAGIAIDSAGNVSAFLSRIAVKYPVYVAGFGGADLVRGFGNAAGALPYTVVIDRAGAVRYAKLGKVDAAELKKILQSL